jgi:hypothetical protein
MILKGLELGTLGIGLGLMLKGQKVVHRPMDLNLQDLALQTHLSSGLAMCVGMRMSTAICKGKARHRQRDAGQQQAAGERRFG